MNATQDWKFDAEADALLHPKGPKPTPRRMRKLLRHEEEHLETLLPGSTTPEAAPEMPPPPKDHDARGRFARGNRCGTGNPFARQVAGFRTALLNSVTEQDFADLAQVLLSKAKSGDLAAIKLFFAYTIGKPTEPPDPDRLDLDDFQILRERFSTLEADWHLIRKMVPVEGILEAGHRVADLRAAGWREEALRQGADPQPSSPEPPPRSPDDVLLDQVLAKVFEEAANGSEADVKALAAFEKVLREAHRTGCLRETLAHLRQEFTKESKRPEATPASTPQAGPSANDGTAATLPAANSTTAATPLANGGAAATPPSPNGSPGRPAPSANGVIGQLGRLANTPPDAGNRR